LLHDEQCTYGNVTSQPKLHLQQTPLLCLEPYKHPKTTELNLNTTKEEGNGNLLSPFLFQQHHKRRQQCIGVVFFFFNTEKKVMTTSCS
jgi:hypothetical protein